MAGDVKSEPDPLARGAEHLVRSEELTERLAEKRPLRVKLGLDPTAREVHLGWAVPLRKLRQFQDAGHTAVLIVGDFTARIGDPSGRSETRPRLSHDEVRANTEACLVQLLDILSEDNLEVRYNSEWLEPLDLSDVLRLTARYTVAQMLQRDDFEKRYLKRQPISMVEFMYPLLQAYDSVAVRADVELGGTDQLFNLLVGRDVQKAYGQQPQICLTMPLLEGLDGVQKMSQSLGNYVGIRELPKEMFGKLMSMPDDLVARYAELTTEMYDEEVARLAAAVGAGGEGAGRAKRAVARAVVALYHGTKEAERAETAFDLQFKDRLVPEEIPQVTIPSEAVEAGVVYLPRVLADLGLASSRSDARRLISQGGVRVGGETTHMEEVPIERVRGAVLQVGKRRFVRLVDQ